MQSISLFVYDNYRVGVRDPQDRSFDVCALRHGDHDPGWMASHAGGCLAAAALGHKEIADALAAGRLAAVTPRVLRSPSPRPFNVFGAPVNYATHRGELGAVRSSTGTTRDLGLFVKAPGSVSGPADPIELPNLPGREFHYEGEIAVLIGRSAEDIPASEALGCVAGFTGALDVTMRLEADHREERSMRKSYKTFTPVGPAVLPFTAADQAMKLSLRLSVNGEQRQHGRLDELIVSIPELVSLASSIVPLEPGDLILSGTPSGVGPIIPGDLVELQVEGLPPMSLRVSAKTGTPGGINPLTGGGDD
jgi:2-keto-4-pentenoate hydratase/2-oxohepta-3-ene-1,7-dioic acid hydratase in catechol pathway